MSLKNTLAVLLLTTVGFASCNSSDSDPAPGIGGSMSAQIDGSSWAAVSTSYNKISSTNVQFTGERSPGSSNQSGIGIELKSYFGIQPYALDATNTAYLVDNSKLYKSTTGQVDVIMDDETWFKAIEVFSEALTVQIIMAVIAINAWNRIGVAAQLHPSVRGKTLQLN